MPVHQVYMSQDTLQKIYNKTQSGSNDPLFLLTPQLLTTELITSLNEKIRNMV